MMFLIFLVFLGLSSANNISEFKGVKVFRLKPTTEGQNEILSKLERENEDLDFWMSPNKVNIPVDVMVQPKDQVRFIKLMARNDIDTELFMDDLGSLISNERVYKGVSRGSLTWTTYYTLAEIHLWLDSLEAAHPGVVEIISAGESYENRNLKGVKISFKPGRRAVFIEGGIHAREWISSATVTYIINELLTSDDAEFRKIAESFDWYIIPVVNPDGFIYTHERYRLWRKTRTPYFPCVGADPNRNWDFHWNEEGSSSNRCSEVYSGPTAFSEPSMKTFSKYLETIGDSLDVYLAFHSYSQLLLIPYGHTSEHLDNHQEVLSIGKKSAEALSMKYGTKYVVGNTAETIYKASGGSSDWVKDKFNVPIVFTYELRDRGKYGFLLPADQIIPNCEEVMDSIVAMFSEADRLGVLEIDDDSDKEEPEEEGEDEDNETIIEEENDH